MRIALGLEYCGIPFCGWQTQPGGCAVQDHVEDALAKFTGARVATVTAGRTDTGVHARAQVIHFDSPVERDAVSWVRGTNTFLHPRVRVLWAQPVADEFHARFAARSRRYDYLLLNDAVGAGLFDGFVGWCHQPLDAPRMHAAAQALVGEHDFTTFRAAECQAATPVRTVSRVSVERSGKLIRLSFTANAFLHHMVRNLVGSLVYVGCGKQPVEWLATLLKGRDRSRAAPTFAASGLYLAEIDYDKVWNLPEFPDRSPLFAFSHPALPPAP